MPNHVINKLRFDCEYDEFLKILEWLRCKDDDCDNYLGTVDFNNIVPMPESLDIESSTTGKNAYMLYEKYIKEVNDIGYDDLSIRAKYEKLCGSKEDFDLGEKYYNNIKMYGCPTWYEWRRIHWGTKSNAYWCEVFDDINNYATDEITFYTAWSGVSGLVMKISEMFNVTVDYWWADEDIGSNLGYEQYESGERIDWDIPISCSKEAFELAAYIRDFDLAENGYVLSDDGSTYEWVGVNQYTGEEIG